MTEDIKKAISARLQKESPQLSGGTRINIAIILSVLLFAGFVIYRIGDNNSFNNNGTIINQVHVNQLKHWSEISKEEQDNIKLEALATFPQIKEIGSGVSWKPVSEWLAQEKGIIHNNPRDLFRNL